MISEWEQAEHDRKMEIWAKKYPFAAMMMFSNKPFKDKLQYAEEQYAKH